MELDTLMLSRIQFATTIMFHYLFPPLSIGLSVLMVMMEGTYLRTRDPDYQALARFWTRVLAINFAVGVATGIVMEFQFGTNWSRYARFVGDVFGSALAAEGIFAFFLESGFLAVLVFGWDRVSPKMHFFATCMVALGSMFSAVWIVIANSWQQTPAGYHLVQTETGIRAEIVDFWAVVFNPSSMQRLTHVILGSWITGAAVVLSVSAYYLLKGRHQSTSRKAIGLALPFGLLATVAIFISGDSQARKVASTQPAKLAALEGLFKTPEGGAPLSLFGIPDERAQELRFEVSIPGLLSFLVSGDPNKPVKGLDQFPRADRPPVLIPFATYHMMVGLGTAQLALMAGALVAWWRGGLERRRWLLWLLVVGVLMPYAANQAGWVCAEVGRQPWVVYGLLRTSDAFSPSVQADQVLASIILFGVIYAMLGAVWAFGMNRKIQHGPDSVVPPETTTAAGLIEAATRRGNPSGESLTEAKSGNVAPTP